MHSRKFVFSRCFGFDTQLDQYLGASNDIFFEGKGDKGWRPATRYSKKCASGSFESVPWIEFGYIKILKGQ